MSLILCGGALVGAVVLSIYPSTHLEVPAVIFNLYVCVIFFLTAVNSNGVGHEMCITVFVIKTVPLFAYLISNTNPL